MASSQVGTLRYTRGASSPSSSSALSSDSPVRSPESSSKSSSDSSANERDSAGATRGTGRPPLFARAAVARTPIAPAPAASAAATRVDPRILPIRLRQLRFFKGPFVECGLVRQLFDVFRGPEVGTLVVEHLGLGFLARSFVAHMRLPIHRSCRSLSSRTRTAPAAPPPRRTSAFFKSSLGAGFLPFLAFVDSFELRTFFKIGATLFRDGWLIANPRRTVRRGSRYCFTAARHRRLRRARLFRVARTRNHPGNQAAAERNAVVRGEPAVANSVRAGGPHLVILPIAAVPLDDLPSDGLPQNDVPPRVAERGGRARAAPLAVILRSGARVWALRSVALRRVGDRYARTTSARFASTGASFAAAAAPTAATSSAATTSSAASTTASAVARLGPLVRRFVFFAPLPVLERIPISVVFVSRADGSPVGSCDSPVGACSCARPS